MSPFVLDIVTHTPLWVWAVLALLVFMGLKQTISHTVSGQRLLVMPIVMGAYSLLGTWNAFGGDGRWLPAAAWVAGAAIGFAANRAIGLPREVRANPDGSFRIGGSVAPLVLFLCIFLLRYAVGVTLAVSPALAGDAFFALAASLASGVPTGLLVARSRKVLAARQPAAGAVAA